MVPVNWLELRTIVATPSRPTVPAEWSPSIGWSKDTMLQLLQGRQFPRNGPNWLRFQLVECKISNLATPSRPTVPAEWSHSIGWSGMPNSVATPSRPTVPAEWSLSIGWNQRSIVATPSRPTVPAEWSPSIGCHEDPIFATPSRPTVPAEWSVNWLE